MCSIVVVELYDGLCKIMICFRVPYIDPSPNTVGSPKRDHAAGNPPPPMRSVKLRYEGWESGPLKLQTCMYHACCRWAQEPTHVSGATICGFPKGGAKMGIIVYWCEYRDYLMDCRNPFADVNLKSPSLRFLRRRACIRYLRCLSTTCSKHWSSSPSYAQR